MRKVIGIGETLLDIIFKDNKPMEAVPGGSTFNAIVSLGRVGANATFVTETGDDHVGGLIRTFLSQNNVNTDYVSYATDGSHPFRWRFLTTTITPTTHSIATPIPTPLICSCQKFRQTTSCFSVRSMQ